MDSKSLGNYDHHAVVSQIKPPQFRPLVVISRIRPNTKKHDFFWAYTKIYHVITTPKPKPKSCRDFLEKNTSLTRSPAFLWGTSGLPDFQTVFTFTKCRRSNQSSVSQGPDGCHTSKNRGWCFGCLRKLVSWLVVSTIWKILVKLEILGNLPQIGVKIRNIWNHHLVSKWLVNGLFHLRSYKWCILGWTKTHWSDHLWSSTSNGNIQASNEGNDFSCSNSCSIDTPEDSRFEPENDGFGRLCSSSQPSEPKTFIFRDYNPYIGGAKPSNFMVLGSHGGVYSQVPC